MKKLILLLLFVPITGLFSQQNVEIDLSGKDYNKILKKLKLKIINRGYDGLGRILVENGASAQYDVNVKYWKDALFEMNVKTGKITGRTAEYETIEADWIISLDKGGYSGKVLDLSDNSKVIAKFDSEKFGMVFQAYRDSKRSDEFKTFVKVIMNELLKSVK